MEMVLAIFAHRQNHVRIFSFCVRLQRLYGALLLSG
uniref:Uncharacterized protein n=1 Tax=Arundo donax TaxID=35708 RepID=A0A0A8ZNU5_ARUDO